MSTLSNLSPNSLWQFFEQICAIPHPSKHEQQLSSWIQEWAKKQGLTVTTDKVGNLFIKKAATAGMEDRKGVILQAHIDMVPQKNSDSDHNFTTDPIVPRIVQEQGDDGLQNWVCATNTTLGADNGIGLASALAVLASKNIPHGPLEVLLTVDEEAGMTGAFALEPGYLNGDILINTDSEEEGEVYMGCAGGIDGQARFALDYQPVPESYQSFSLSVSGLKGGHSGVDINTGRANANKLLVQFLLQACQQFSLQISNLSGGSLRNAIPREAQATFALEPSQIPAFKTALKNYQQVVSSSLSRVENNITFTFNDTDAVQQVWTEDCQTRILNAINACPNGVMRMSDDIDGVVESSINLGIMKTEVNAETGAEFIALTLIRSLHQTGQEQVQAMVKSVFDLAGAELKFSGAYPGWQPDPDSAIMKTVRSTYQQLFDKLPDIMVIHAGLECGLFKAPYPHWDMVSFGPTIKYPHSPDEKVLVSSVARYWQLLVAVLANVPNK